MGNVDQVFIALTFADGTTGLMGFVVQERHPNGSVRWTKEPTEEEIERIILQASTSIPTKEHPHWNAAFAMEKVPVQSWRILSEEERAMFEQRDYRNALVDTGKSIQHDMTKAREIHRDKLRRAREPLLAGLDIAYQRADELADGAAADTQKASIAGQKQTLRDVTDDPAIEAAQTIEELRAVWPAELRG